MTEQPAEPRNPFVPIALRAPVEAVAIEGGVAVTLRFEKFDQPVRFELTYEQLTATLDTLMGAAPNGAFPFNGSELIKARAAVLVDYAGRTAWTLDTRGGATPKQLAGTLHGLSHDIFEGQWGENMTLNGKPTEAVADDVENFLRDFEGTKNEGDDKK